MVWAWWSELLSVAGTTVCMAGQTKGLDHHWAQAWKVRNNEARCCEFWLYFFRISHSKLLCWHIYMCTSRGDSLCVHLAAMSEFLWVSVNKLISCTPETYIVVSHLYLQQWKSSSVFYVLFLVTSVLLAHLLTRLDGSLVHFSPISVISGYSECLFLFL